MSQTCARVPHDGGGGGGGRGRGPLLQKEELGGRNGWVVIVQKVTSAQSATTGRRAA